MCPLLLPGASPGLRWEMGPRRGSGAGQGSAARRAKVQELQVCAVAPMWGVSGHPDRFASTALPVEELLRGFLVFPRHKREWCTAAEPSPCHPLSARRWLLGAWPPPAAPELGPGRV